MNSLGTLLCQRPPQHPNPNFFAPDPRQNLPSPRTPVRERAIVAPDLTVTLRYYHPLHLFEVTTRTVAGAQLLDPVAYPEFGPALTGILARAQRKYGVRIYAYFVMSNHYHAIYGADTPDALADFLCAVHANMAILVNRVLDRYGPVFAGRCHIRPIVVGETVLMDRLCYIMGQAMKAHERWTIDNWPGANSNRALMYGEPAAGRLFDYHRQTLDKRRKSGASADEAYTSELAVQLSVAPCWMHLPEPEIRAKYLAVAAEAVRKFAKGGIVQNHESTQESPVPPSAVGQGPPLTDAPPPAPGRSHAGVPSPSEVPLATDAVPTAATPIPAASNEAAHPVQPPPPWKLPAYQPPTLTDEQKRAMQAMRPRPKAAKEPRDRKRKKLPVHADTRAEQERYMQAYEQICEAHAQARAELAEQAERALRGLSTKAVRFPLYTFAAVVRTGRLALQLGLSAPVGGEQ
jgi:hypothetical protein